VGHAKGPLVGNGNGPNPQLLPVAGSVGNVGVQALLQPKPAPSTTISITAPIRARCWPRTPRMLNHPWRSS